ncbi:restriction endonuclease subunit S [Bacillus mycoides]|uniref:restriction endonuclease subunit S n=1 Tax=Bacillus mycoides TaxID=1405 RepID=UPI0029307677|nr:restriction endonuclease subunit S [Bacillus mycoides]WOA64425.1 restriction endonuclease subunit S [Bacillus mycoides]
MSEKVIPKEYTNTGILWIDKIPNRWSITKVKYTTYVKGRIGWQGLKSDEFIDEGPYLVTGTDFDNGYINWGTCYHISEKRYDEAPSIQLKENDLLITKDGTIGKVAIVKKIPSKAILNSGIFVTRSNKYEVEYMYWLLNSVVFDKYIKFHETGSTIKHLYQETFENFSYPLPDRNEQKRIVMYLNEEISKIDLLIGDKEKLINLLEEKRQSMITEAVTKGLNPNAKMKDSGVEWIDEIPSGWNIAKLKYFSQRIGDGLHGTPIYDDNGEIYFINGNNLGLKEIRLTENTNKISLEEFMKYKQSIGSNTILISLNGTIGKLSIYNEETIMLSKSAGFINLKESINKEFVYYFLKSSIVKNFYEQSFAGTTINNLSLETLRNTPLLVPDIEAQKEIVNYLNNLEFDFEKVLGELHLQTQKLKNFRQSLIYEAVTGKIDVSDWEVEA